MPKNPTVFKSVIGAMILLVTLGTVFLFSSVETDAAAYTPAIHDSVNNSPFFNARIETFEDTFQSGDSTTLSFNIGEDWNCFIIQYENGTAGTWVDVAGWTYTDLHYDSLSKPETIQATFSATVVGLEWIVIAMDFDEF